MGFGTGDPIEFPSGGRVAPTLRTPRLLLRLLNPSDRAEFVRVHQISRDFYRAWMPTAPASESLEFLFDRQLERAARGWSAGSQLRLVGARDDGRIAGFFTLNEIVYGSFWCAYAGWRVSIDVARQGFGTEALTGLLDLAFAPPPAGLGLHRVQANIIPSNEASLKLAARCGFRREGLALRYLQINGRWQDHVMTAKLADEHAFVHLNP